MKTAIFTIASKNYMSFVRNLFNSVEKLYPDFPLYLCLADTVDDCLNPGKEIFTLVEAETIGVPDLYDRAMRYTILEFNTALKPSMMKWLFRHEKMDAVIYLDADIHLFSPMHEVMAKLSEGVSAILTPHITEPLLDDGKYPSDRDISRAGIYNLGFIAMRNTRESLSYLDWWEKKHATQCRVEVESGLFVDQKWCDFLPAFIKNCHIERGVNYNVAYWNLAHRFVSKNPSGAWMVNGKPLVFFHFSGVDPDDPTLISRHQNRFSWDNIGKTRDVFAYYCSEVAKYDWTTSKNREYHYGKFPNGDDITDSARRLYRRRAKYPIAFDSWPEAIHYLTELLQNES